jgi:seryl-tRNA synthetase
MIDINFIKQNQDLVVASMKKRCFDFDLSAILSIDETRREIMTKTQVLQAEKNAVAKKMGQAKMQKNETEAQIALKEGEAIKIELEQLEKFDRENQETMKNTLATLPNILQDLVPIGADEDENVVIKTVGTPRVFDFTPKHHHEIGEPLGMDFELGRKISGSRFVVLKNQLAKMERALAAFMIDCHANDFGYNEVSVPLLVNENSMFGTGQLPKFDNGYQTTDGMYLIPTSEVPVTNIVNGDILSLTDLPLRFCCYSQCFRSESGSAGKDVVGMIRQHQFSKVELVSIVHPDKSQAEHERMLTAAENILQKLELPYQVSLLCSGDTGFSSSKTYDIEVWLPAQNKYREISSCSNMMDFQARRMMARFKDESGKNQYLHTLNGSGLAIGRTMIAIIENYQNSDGSFAIPTALRSYMNGAEKIG